MYKSSYKRDATKYFHLSGRELAEKARQYNLLLNQVFLTESGAPNIRAMGANGEKSATINFSDPLFQDMDNRARFLNEAASIMQTINMHEQVSKCLGNWHEVFQCQVATDSFEEHLRRGVQYYGDNAPMQAL